MLHQGWAFSVLWPASRYLSPRIRCFIDFMAAADTLVTRIGTPPLYLTTFEVISYPTEAEVPPPSL